MTYHYIDILYKLYIYLTRQLHFLLKQEYITLMLMSNVAVHHLHSIRKLVYKKIK